MMVGLEFLERKIEYTRTVMHWTVDLKGQRMLIPSFNGNPHWSRQVDL